MGEPNAKEPKRRARREPIIVQGDLSCVTYLEDARGRRVDWDSFDVPAESYGDGNITGDLLAVEFMDSLQRQRQGFDVLAVIKAACVVLDRSDSRCGSPGRRGAAVGFLRSLESVLRVAARLRPFHDLVQANYDRAVEWRKESAERDKVERRDFAERMEIAKAAKARAVRGTSALIARVAKD